MADLLQVEGLSAGYGEAVVLTDIAFAMADGQSLALLGRNGTGKTTLINSLLGLTTHKAGTIRLAGRDITRERPEGACRPASAGAAGAQHLPLPHGGGEPDRGRRPGVWAVERVFAMFPRLAQRRGNLGSQLSGASTELAIGRALIVTRASSCWTRPLEA